MCAAHYTRTVRTGDPQADVPIRASGRLCPTCQERKPTKSFGAHASCRVCRARAGQTGVRERHLVARYGITGEHYQAMLGAQGGVCAICRRPPGKTRLAVDHDHETGRVRGLLCAACNTALGLLGDDAATIARAVAYLRADANAVRALPCPA